MFRAVVIAATVLLAVSFGVAGFMWLVTPAYQAGLALKLLAGGIKLVEFAVVILLAVFLIRSPRRQQ